MNSVLYEEYAGLRGALDTALEELTAAKEKVYGLRSHLRSIEHRVIWYFAERDRPLEATFFEQPDLWNDPFRWDIEDD